MGAPARAANPARRSVADRRRLGAAERPHGRAHARGDPPAGRAPVRAQPLQPPAPAARPRGAAPPAAGTFGRAYARILRRQSHHAGHHQRRLRRCDAAAQPGDRPLHLPARHVPRPARLRHLAPGELRITAFIMEQRWFAAGKLFLALLHVLGPLARPHRDARSPPQPPARPLAGPTRRCCSPSRSKICSSSSSPTCSGASACWSRRDDQSSPRRRPPRSTCTPTPVAIAPVQVVRDGYVLDAEAERLK